MNVLAIGAHGDDLEAFCGGTLAKHARNGDRVVMCVATDGSGRPKGDPAEITRIRKAEAQASADVIGAELIWIAAPDGFLTVNHETRHLFVEAIRASEPDYIITHPPQDYHPDHVATSHLVMEASQVARTTNYDSKYPPLRKNVAVAFMSSELGIEFTPESYVDISDVWEMKVKMLLQHRSQHMPGPTYDPHYQLPEDPETLGIIRAARVMSEFYGLALNARYGEVFRWWRAANRIVSRQMLP